jgi:hypothetical protein
MNERFVNIKVDREERPTRLHLHASGPGHDGPRRLADDGVPHPRDGVPFWRHLLPAGRSPGCRIPRSSRRWRSSTGSGVARREPGGPGAPRAPPPERARPGRRRTSSRSRCSTPRTRELRSEFDARHGGLGRAPKFPQPMAFDFLLRYWRHRMRPTRSGWCGRR